MAFREPITRRPTPQRIKELRRIAARIQEINSRKIESEKNKRARRIITAVGYNLENFSNNPTNIHRYLPEAELRTMNRNYTYSRGLKEYNKDLKTKKRRFFIQNIIKSFPKRKIRLLDLGAGEGQLGLDLKQRFPNTPKSEKQLEYHGIDILKSRRNPRVQQGNIEYMRLPKNTFDIITAIWSLDYTVNKLEVITNCCDALQVGGKFILLTSNDITINYQYDPFEYVNQIIKYNPHLKVDYTSTEGIIITKISQGITKLPFRLNSAEPVLDFRWKAKYLDEDELNNLKHPTSAIRSNYTTKVRE